MWTELPPSLHAVEAVMGAELPRSTRDAMQACARSHSKASPDKSLTPSEIGILLSNEKAWTHALEQGWDWSLILEDDSTARLTGGVPQLLALLPTLVEAATAVDPEWQLLVLSPWNLDTFYEMVEPARIPALHADGLPAWIRRPYRLGKTGWRRIGPTFHAFGWVYRAPLMRKLVAAMRARSPPLNPLDLWVWEVMAEHGMLGCALSPVVVEARERDPTTRLTPEKFDGEFSVAMVGTRSMPGSHDSLNAHS